MFSSLQTRFAPGSWGRKVLMGLVALLLVGIGAWAFAPPPHAQGALRGHTVEVSRNGVFRVIFSQPMDRKSVERAFRINPSLEGSFHWSFNELTFTPAAGMEKGRTYEVTIDTSARSLLLKPLAESYRQSFSIVDYPDVSVFAPVDKSIVMQDQVVTVLFDHPLRTLTGTLDVPEFLKITPSVKGRYQWLGTSGFEFIPEGGWPAATEFTVTLPKGTKTADGGSTIEDRAWTFATPALTVSLASVASHHKPAEPVKLEFNYSVKPDAVAKSIVILEGETGLSADQFEFGVDKERERVITVTKKGHYQLGKIYTFKLAKGYTADLGPLGLKEDWQQVVAMDELGFKVMSTSPTENGKKPVYDGVAVCFNNPVDAETFAKGIKVTPELEGLQVTPYAYLPTGCANQDATLTVSGRWKPSTDYTISLSEGLADVYAQKLAPPYQLRFATDPYRPSVDVSTQSIYGVMAAHLPRVYQVRTLNWGTTITATLETSSFEAAARRAGGGALKGKRVYETNAPLNSYKILDIDLDALAGEKLPNGFYHLSFAGMPPEIGPRSLMIADTALTVKRDRAGKVLVWATDMQTGQVVPNLSVQIWTGLTPYDRSELRKIGEGKTDAQGIASLQVEESTKVDTLIVKASDAKRLGYVETEWNEGIDTWNYGLERTYDRSNKHHIGHAYTERRIYRPDQKVFFKGVVRLDEDARLSLPKERNVRVTIDDPTGNQVWSEQLTLNTFGTFNGSFQLDPAMKLGTYRLSAVIEADREEPRPIETTFDVREYRRPDFKVELTPSVAPVFAGQKIEIPVSGAYYHGVPLKGAKVRYDITRTKLFFQPMQGRWWNEWYSFTSDEQGDCYWYCRTEGSFESVQGGDAELDANGKLTITLPANLTDYASSATYFVDVTVTDVNQRQVSSRLEFPVHKGEFYLGIRADYSQGWDAPNADFEMVSILPDGGVKPNVKTTVKLYKRTWSNTKKVGTDGSSFWEWQKSDALKETKSLTTDGEGKARVSFATTEDGDYVAVVEARDERGQLVSASAYRYIYRGLGGGVRVSDDHHMKIVQNKASYDVGDTASLAVQSPYQATKALVTIERNTIREYRVIDLGSKQRTVELKITEADTPNVYVSVLAVQGGGDKSLPEFRLGYANLQVNTTRKILNMTVTPDREAHRPGESVTLTIDAKNSEGKPVVAEVSVAVVDERVIALLGAIDKDMLGKFWFPRLLGVDTGQSLTKLVKKVFFSPTEGGGGGGKGEGATSAVRGNFQDTAYWNATVVTGEDGKARVTFTLPDNLTSWNVLAIGETKDTLVGHAESKIVTRRDLMAEPLMPRILRHQDTVTVGATLVNATDRGFDAEAELKAEGVTVDGGARKVHVDAQGRAVATWTVRVPREGTQAKFTITAKGGGYEDGFVVTIPVLDFSVPEVVSASGILEKNVTETLEIPEGIMSNVGQVDVSVQPNIGNGLQTGLEYLVQYPYGCSEQKTSGLLANLIYEELSKLKVTKGDPTRLEDARRHVRDTVKLLISMQRGDGGWSFWPEYDRSYPWLTSYVFWGLTQAQKAGFEVDANALDRADQYLRQALQYPADTNYRSLQDSERAQIVFMLSERNIDGLGGYAGALYDRRDSLPSFAKLFLSMAYTNLDRGRTSARAVQLLGEVKNKVVYLNPSTVYVKAEEGYEELLSSDLRTTSLYIQALLRLDPKHEDVERALRYLVQNRKDGYWYTTHDTAMTLLGLVEYVRAKPVDESTTAVSLFLNNELKETMKFEQGDVSGAQTKVFSLGELSKVGSKHQIGLEKESEKRYFYDMNMKVYREIQDIEPFDNGMTVIADTYALLDRNHEKPLTEVTQGENVRVRLKLLVPKRRRYVALEYHLPAGLEAVDFQLKTSPQSIAGEEKRCYPGWDGSQRCLADWEWGWWWEYVWKHIEYRDDRVFLFAETLEPGVYEYDFVVQAATPGEYRVPPARAYEFYNPTANAHTEGKVLKVRPK